MVGMNSAVAATAESFAHSLRCDQMLIVASTAASAAEAANK
jgi:hypothetical protein